MHNTLEENYIGIKRYNRNYIIYLLFINIIIYISANISKKYERNGFSPYAPGIKEIKIGEGNSTKIGIISDIQLTSKYTKSFFKYFQHNLYRALEVFKKNNVDIIIIAGDITDNGEPSNYLLFNEVFYSVYNSNNSPFLISLMGNHDYTDMKTDNNYIKIQEEEKFYNYMKSYPYSHYIINKYNFIFWSNDYLSYTDYFHNVDKVDDTWIKSTLEKAKKNKNKEGDPIFVITHIPPKKTVNGSETYWGSQRIYDILKDYPEVICISGHSHYSLRNIKSIWQGSFTAINTQSISYVDLDNYYLNLLDVRMDSAKNDSMGLIAYLNHNNVIFDRIQFETEEILEEQWKIDFPIKISDFQYTFEKRNKKIKPVFIDKNEVSVEKIDNKNYIVFNAAYHEDYVYKYKIILKSKDNYIQRTYLYYSDYYKNKKLRKEIIKFELRNVLVSSQYNVEIYAIDSFDNISEPKFGVINI